MRLKNKAALITGASRGIGKEIAIAFAKEGAKIMIHYNKEEEKAIQVQKQIQNIGEEAYIYRADITNRIEVDCMMREFIGKFEKIDVLINNAGISFYQTFMDITEEDWKKIMDVNINGMFHCSQSALKYMLLEKKGKLINISSMWGMVGASCEVHYSAAKGAVISFTKALAKELGPSQILVNCIAPGVIQTDMLNCFTEEELRQIKEETPLGRIGTVQDIAQTAIFLASKESDFITGQVLGVNGGFVI